MRDARRLTRLVGAPVVSVALVACGTVDPAVPMRLPSNDYAIGVSAGLTWDELADPLAIGKPSRGSQGSVALDLGWLDGIFGVHGGLSLHGELATERLSLRAEASAWYGLLFGLGLRVGWLVGEPIPAELASPPLIPRPDDLAVDLTALLAVPIPLWSDPSSGSLVIAPYGRPGLRVTGAASGVPREDRIRGFHEVGLTLRWTSFAF